MIWSMTNWLLLAALVGLVALITLAWIALGALRDLRFQVFELRAAEQKRDEQRWQERRRVFGRESEYGVRLGGNGKNYAVTELGLDEPLAVFAHSNHALGWREQRFPSATVAEVTDVLSAVDPRSSTRVSEGE